MRLLKSLLALASLLVEALRIKPWLHTKVARFKPNLWLKSTLLWSPQSRSWLPRKEEMAGAERGKGRGEQQVHKEGQPQWLVGVKYNTTGTGKVALTPQSSIGSTRSDDSATLTIKELADIYRALLLSEMKPAQFAKECMRFDEAVVPDGWCDVEGDLGEGDEQTSRVIGVLNRLAATGFEPPAQLLPTATTALLHPKPKRTVPLSPTPLPTLDEGQRKGRKNKQDHVEVAETYQEREERLRQHQLALIWLDGHDYSAIKLSDLAIELVRLRDIQARAGLSAEAEAESETDESNFYHHDENENEDEVWGRPSEGERDWENW